MAGRAVAQDVLFALRREIARIEGVLPERLAPSSCPASSVVQDQAAGREEADAVLMRRGGRLAHSLLETGVADLDAILGGGLPLGALTEIHAPTARDAGAASGLALALAALLLRGEAGSSLPLLWLGTREAFSEAGYPYAPGLAETFGIAHRQLIFAETPKLLDMLWIAEEAARLPDLAAVFLELRGNPQKLDLTATRRLHRRAMAAGRPVFLLRQSAQAVPTAAPVRLLVSPAPAAPRQTLAGPLLNSIGPPGVTVTVDKSRTARSGTFILEWNPDERSLQARPFEDKWPAIPGAVVSTAGHGPDLAQAAGQVLELPAARRRAGVGDLAAGEQHAADRGARRAG